MTGISTGTAQKQKTWPMAKTTRNRAPKRRTGKRNEGKQKPSAIFPAAHIFRILRYGESDRFLRARVLHFSRKPPRLCSLCAGTTPPHRSAPGSSACPAERHCPEPPANVPPHGRCGVRPTQAAHFAGVQSPPHFGTDRAYPAPRVVTSATARRKARRAIQRGAERSAGFQAFHRTGTRMHTAPVRHEPYGGGRSAPDLQNRQNTTTFNARITDKLLVRTEYGIRPPRRPTARYGTPRGRRNAPPAIPNRYRKA